MTQQPEAEAGARIAFARGMSAGDLRLYAILDGESCARRGLDLLQVARAWSGAGIRLVQYRDKQAALQQIVARGRELRQILPAATLILNDHPQLVAECVFDGVHVGQGDLPIEEARALIGSNRLLGISTHSADEALAASQDDVDYVAIGPVYPTSTKLDTEPAVGLCGVSAARAVLRKPLIAIGGIGMTQGREVLRTGADSVAVISALLEGDLRIHAVALLSAFA